jgi:hypothetical protein
VSTLLYVGGSILALLAIWFGSHALESSRHSGWTILARTYAVDHPFEGSIWRFPDVSFRTTRGWTAYGITLVLGTNAKGLYLRQNGFFRMRHPAILVPWADIRFEDVQSGAFGKSVSLFLGPDPAIEMSCKGRIIDQLLKYKTQSVMPPNNRLEPQRHE